MKEKYCNIGGQALIEGVMMKGGSTIAMSVRTPSGEIETKIEKTHQFTEIPFFKLPFIRGSVALFSSMITGIQALTYSAEFYMEDEEKGKFELWLEDHFKENADKILMAFSLISAFVMAILFFSVLPAVLTAFFKTIVTNAIALSAIEGVIKMALFLGYIFAISRLPDIKRVFEYHGAEHKTINCYEAGKELTPENAKEFTRIHPRCGTSFLIFVMAISIVIFSFISWHSIAMRIVLKILLLPVVAGISYEVLKFSAKSDNAIVKAISYPGQMLQLVTTNEPDLKQLAVAIAAMDTVLEKEGLPKCFL